MAQRKASYDEFWPYYLAEHSKPSTRAFHFVGTGLAIYFAVASVIQTAPHWLLIAVVSGYFFAWIGHFFMEKNTPATFTHPVWSLLSDFRMFFLFLGRGLESELEKYGIEPKE